jgi:PTH2 family peptidyl-tRNA hydrolase
MYKQAIVVRKDLDWNKGKLAAHVAHAAVDAALVADEDVVKKWQAAGGKKVVLKIEDLKSLSELRKKARDAKLPVVLIRDAGLTQLKRGTVTCLSIGPADEKKVDKITGKLKLL